MDIKEIYKLFIDSSGICTNSKTISKDSIFIGLKGDNFNGGKFAQQALSNGASYAFVDDQLYQDDERIFLVDDTLMLLQNLANYHRKALDIPILAITGTNGKTTTKELIASVLSKKIKIGYTQGNFNNHIGVPLTLLSFNNETEFGIVEMGANHPNEIEKLCKIAEPNYGLITNVGKAHLEGFGSFQNIIKTKGELYDFLHENGGFAFINGRNEHLLETSKRLKRKLIYGIKESDIQTKLNSKRSFVEAKVTSETDEIIIQSNLIGEFNLENILAAVNVGNYFKVDWHDMKEAIESYHPKNNRSQLIQNQKYDIVMDAYNANPTSMTISIKSFINSYGNNTCLILGDMLELGSNSLEEHTKILQLVEDLKVKNALFIGTEFRSASVKNEKTFKNVTELNEYLKKQMPPEHSILIKGSRGIQLEKSLDVLNS